MQFTRSRSYTLAISALLLLTLGSCTQLLSGVNLFQNFDGPPTASDLLSDVGPNGEVATANAESFVNGVSEALDSPQFTDGLSDSDRDRLGAALENVYNNGAVANDVVQNAALAAGDVAIDGTAAEQVINNVVDIAVDSNADFNDPATLLTTLIPADVQNDVAAITEILESLSTAGAAYMALTPTLTDTDGDGEVDYPSGVNSGAVTQQAAISILVNQLTTDNTVAMPPTPGTAVIAAAIADGTLADGTAMLTFTGFDTQFTTATSQFSTILEAGGLSGVFNSP